MDSLKNKQYLSYEYNSRYVTVPAYYDTLRQRDVYGIGTQMVINDSYISHQLKPTDTLDSLALKYYNNPTFWWVIANFNNILDPFAPLMNKFNLIKIPNISSIEFGAERK